MKKTVKFTALALSVMMAGGLLAGCGGDSKSSAEAATSAGTGSAASTDSKDVALKVWADQDVLDITKDLVEQFKAAHPEKNYTIDVVFSESGKAEEEVKKDPEAAADVIALPHDQLGQLVEAGTLYENTKYVDRIKSEDTPTALDAATYKETVYGYPYAVEAMYLVYNKTMLTEEDVKTFEGITAKAKIGLNVAEEGTNYTVAPMYIANGCKLFGDNGEDIADTTFNSEQGVNVTKWIASLKDNKNVVACNADAMNKLKSGEIAAMVTGPWGKKDITDALGENLGVAVYPTADFGDGAVQLRSFQGVKLLAVNAATKYPLDAMELADFLTNQESQKARFEGNGNIPCNNALRESDEVKNDMISGVVSEMTQEDYTVLMPKLSELRSFWDILDPIIIDAYAGKLSDADIQTKLDALVNDTASAAAAN